MGNERSRRKARRSDEVMPPRAVLATDAEGELAVALSVPMLRNPMT